MARNNKQTSVKNRRMNPPRPALQNRGTVFPEPVGNLELRASCPSPQFVLAAFVRLFVP